MSKTSSRLPQAGFRRRAVLMAGAATAATSLMGLTGLNTAHAQAYPNKTIRLIIA